MGRKITAIAVAALALSLCGCWPDEGRPEAASTESPPPADSSMLALGAQDERIEADTPEPSPTHDAESDAEAVTVASAALTAYLRHDVPQRAWLEGLEPHLTTAATVALGSVDVASIPSGSPPGEIVLERDASGYLARAVAQTGTGTGTGPGTETFVLLLVRQGSGPWLVSEIAQSENGAS
ncbi:hypothetical protein C5B85_14915 [Pseudoclavibacter sp. AY1F1]|uniref:hypothetical protein n=1 Tax=Pseudoclavibacter sp. AY1F1 TaxID=2080583 RepID=UPI000CE8A763|nr:hypothetical protein [Pseudoclavibacter sp. AY1F1]PPF42867.1 hypothetical protein C5B85_14915 [Pseudoclavibacter sp. AY1F1]